MSETPPNPTQATRRTKYGLNVTIAIVAALLIVVALNYIVDDAFRRVSERSPQTTEWLRYDLTATRQYSLSPQTIKVLADLQDDYTLVALVDPLAQTEENRVQVQRVVDLVQEYGRYSPKLTVEQINPATDAAKADRLYQQLRKHYEAKLQPMIEAVDKGKAALERVKQEIAQVTTLMGGVGEDATLTNQASKRMVEAVAAALARLDSDLQPVEAQAKRELEQPLPDYGQVRQVLTVTLAQIDDKMLTKAVDAFTQVNRVADTPDGVKDKLLQAINRMTATREVVRQAVSDLQFVEPVEGYDRMRTALLSQESVVVLGPDRVRVVPLNEMFRAVPTAVAEQAGELELGFIGEEKLTGAIVATGLENLPMVVFVQPSPYPAIGQGRPYEYVAHRLRNASLRVEQWLPAGQAMQAGQTMPAGPPPKAEPGQKTVWIVLPFPPPNPNNPMSLMNTGEKTKVTQLLDARMAAGDAAMVMLRVEPDQTYGEPDPLVGWLNGYSVYPQLDKLVLHQVRLPDRRSANTARFVVTQWPADSPITQALAGMSALFEQTSPIEMTPPESAESAEDSEGKNQNKDEGAKPQATVTPLVVLRAADLWATSDLVSAQQVQDAPIDEKTRRDTYTVGVAAERDDQRLIVVTDPLWAMDRITNNASPDLDERYVGSADFFGAAYPGNAELFINGTYWLAGLDELIAASPRTQDIRRIDALSPAALTAWRWSLVGGMPVLILAAGVCVWLVRRKG